MVKKIPLDENGQKILGYCYTGENYIEVERDQPDKEFLSTLIHEILHHLSPAYGEQKIIQMEKIMAEAIWRKGYRSKRRKR